jgi:hypothetical protein
MSTVAMTMTVTVTVTESHLWVDYHGQGRGPPQPCWATARFLPRPAVPCSTSKASEPLSE